MVALAVLPARYGASRDLRRGLGVIVARGGLTQGARGLFTTEDRAPPPSFLPPRPPPPSFLPPRPPPPSFLPPRPPPPSFLPPRPPPPSFLRKQESSGRGGDGLLLHWIPAVTLADAGPGRPAFALDSCPRVRRHRHSCESRNPVAGAGAACFCTGFPPSPSPNAGPGRGCRFCTGFLPSGGRLRATVIPAAGIQWPGRGWPVFTLDSCRHPRRCGAGAACFCTGFLPPRPPPPSFLRKQESSGRGGGGLLLHWIPAVTLADAGPGRPAFALDSCPRVRRHRHSCESRNPVAGAGAACFCTGFPPSPSPMRGRGGLLLHWIPAFASAATVIPATGAGAACFCTGFLPSPSPMRGRGGLLLHWIPAPRPPPPSFLRKQESSGRGGDGLLLHWIPAVTLADAGPGRPAFALDSCFRRNDGSAGLRSSRTGAGAAGFALDSCRHPRRCGAGAACFCTGFLLSQE